MNRLDAENNANLARMADAMESVAKSLKKMNEVPAVRPIGVKLEEPPPQIPRYHNHQQCEINNLVEDLATGEKLSLQCIIDRLNNKD